MVVRENVLLQLCDQYGAKLLARYVQHRRLQQLISETSTLSHARRTSAPAQATLAVDPRQVMPAPRPIRPITAAASLPERDMSVTLSACQLTWTVRSLASCVGPSEALQTFAGL